MNEKLSRLDAPPASVPKFNRAARRRLAKKLGLFKKQNRKKYGFAST